MISRTEKGTYEIYSYELSDAELRSGMNTIDHWLEITGKGRSNINPENIPWKAMSTLLSQAIYGGKMDKLSRIIHLTSDYWIVSWQYFSIPKHSIRISFLPNQRAKKRSMFLMELRFKYIKIGFNNFLKFKNHHLLVYQTMSKRFSKLLRVEILSERFFLVKPRNKNQQRYVMQHNLC